MLKQNGPPSDCLRIIKKGATQVLMEVDGGESSLQHELHGLSVSLEKKTLREVFRITRQFQALAHTVFKQE